MPGPANDQDRLFTQAASDYGAALERLARAYEADDEERRDLLQEIYVALWRSFAGFDERCSLRTWVYRVAHNVAASHVDRQARRRKREFISLEEIESYVDEAASRTLAQQQVLGEIYAMIRELAPLDRQVMLAYLEGLDAASTAEITGLTASHVATKIHRIKRALSRRFREGGSDE